MLARQGNPLTFYVQFIESKVGKTGLTVTVDVYKKPVLGPHVLVTSAQPTTAMGGGVYYYELPAASVDISGEFVLIFKTSTTTVDQREIAVVWTTDKRVNAQLQACDADSITAAALAADAGVEIRTGLATSAALTAIGDRLPAALVDGRIAAQVGAYGAGLAPPTRDSITGGAYALATDAAGRVKLAADALDTIPATVPDGVATTFVGRLMQTWARFFLKARKEDGQIRTYREDGQVNTTQLVTESGGAEEVGNAT